MRSHFRWVQDGLLIQLRVTPRASRDQVGSLMGDRLKVSITAPPVDGQANQHLLKFVAKQFGVSASQVALVSGISSRDKTVCIRRPQKFPEAFQVTESP